METQKFLLFSSTTVPGHQINYHTSVSGQPLAELQESSALTLPGLPGKVLLWLGSPAGSLLRERSLGGVLGMALALVLQKLREEVGIRRRAAAPLCPQTARPLSCLPMVRLVLWGWGAVGMRSGCATLLLLLLLLLRCLTMAGTSPGCFPKPVFWPEPWLTWHRADAETGPIFSLPQVHPLSGGRGHQLERATTLQMQCWRK